MEKDLVGKVALPTTVQIGMVVRNIDKVMQFYSSAFSIGPWLTRDGETEAKTPDGRVHKYKTKTAFAHLGPAQLELFQVTEGRSPVHSDWLDKGYEGVHHLGFFVTEEEKQRMPAQLVTMGIEVYQERQSNLFMNTVKTGGVFFEFVHTPTGMPQPPAGPSVAGKVKLPPNLQLGIVVKDVDTVADFYSSAFGIGPWQKRTGGSEARVDGQSYVFKTQVAFATFAGIQLELFTVTEGSSPVHSVFLDKGREGVHHFGFFVSEGEKQRIKQGLAEIGRKVFQEGEVPKRGRYVFFDTRNPGGLFFEFVAPLTE